MDEHRQGRGHVASAAPVDKRVQGAARQGETASEECCDRCGSLRLIRVKACWRCEACGYKSDCNGW